MYTYLYVYRHISKDAFSYKLQKSSLSNSDCICKDINYALNKKIWNTGSPGLSQELSEALSDPSFCTTTLSPIHLTPWGFTASNPGDHGGFSHEHNIRGQKAGSTAKDELLMWFLLFFAAVQSLSHTHLFVTTWTAACQASLSTTISRSLLKLMSVELVMPSNQLILCCPHLLLPSTFPSIRVVSNELALCIRWPKCWSFSISPSNEYSGFTSFRIDWFDLFAVQWTLKSLLQYHSSIASILQGSAFFTVHPNIHTWLLEKP